MSIPNRTAHSVCSYKKCKISHVTCEMQVILCYCKARAAEAQNQAEVGVSAERFRGDAGRPLVAADHSRHDAARFSKLQRIHGVLRRHCNEYPRGSFAEAGRLRNYR